MFVTKILYWLSVFRLQLWLLLFRVTIHGDPSPLLKCGESATRWGSLSQTNDTPAYGRVYPQKIVWGKCVLLVSYNLKKDTIKAGVSFLASIRANFNDLNQALAASEMHLSNFTTTFRINWNYSWERRRWKESS